VWELSTEQLNKLLAIEIDFFEKEKTAKNKNVVRTLGNERYWDVQEKLSLL